MRLATIEQREIFLMQILDDFSLRIPDHDADKNQIDADLENGRRVTRFYFWFPGFLRSSWTGVLRGARRGLRGGRLRAFIASGRRLGK